MLSRIPMPKRLAIKELPPALKKGSGIPVHGDKFIVIPILTVICVKNIEKIPIATNEPNLSLAYLDIIIPRLTITNNIIKTNIAPINPNSSAIIEKIKSV